MSRRHYAFAPGVGDAQDHGPVAVVELGGQVERSRQSRVTDSQRLFARTGFAGPVGYVDRDDEIIGRVNSAVNGRVRLGHKRQRYRADGIGRERSIGNFGFAPAVAPT